LLSVTATIDIPRFAGQIIAKFRHLFVDSKELLHSHTHNEHLVALHLHVLAIHHHFSDRLSILSSACRPLTHSRRLSFVSAAIGLSFFTALPAQATESSEGWNQVLSTPAPLRRLALLPPPLPSIQPTFAITPERRALLNTIRYAEGTWANGHDVGYRVMFGGSLMPSLERHPNRVMYSSRYASAAAGAYQFMPPTWDMVTQKLGLSGFGPDSQDQGALYLIQRRGALHLADRGEMTEELAARLAPEWASFPTLQGQSYYGQPVKRFDDLKRFYEGTLSQLRQIPQQWEPVAIETTKPCKGDSLECQLNAIRSSNR
jgi:muramidase (phage lysozyme)